MKVLVAVHGMGDQSWFSTSQDLAHRTFGYHGLPNAVPMGLLSSGIGMHYLGGLTGGWAESETLTPRTGFSEVHWADLARKAEGEHVLEDSVAWAETIVERLRLTQAQCRKAGTHPAPIDYVTVTRILVDVNRAIRGALLFNRGLKKLGLGSMELDQLLARYLGDVQLFAEFAPLRHEVIGRFNDSMKRIQADSKKIGEKAEIHLCAHSQGSVVAFYALLEGYRKQEPWLDDVKSLMTIGSPIDKFLLLWHELWEDWQPPDPAQPPPTIQPRIRWFNYADRGDPVGYQLDTARAWVANVAPGLFAARAPEEKIFRRYVIPGKAHIDYWKDQELFDEWLSFVYQRPPSVTVKDRFLPKVLSPFLPFAAAAGLAAFCGYQFGVALEKIWEAGPLPELDLKFPHMAALALLVLGFVSFGGASRYSLRFKWLFIGFVLLALGSWSALTQFSGLEVQIAVGGSWLFGIVQNVFDRWGRKK